MLAQVNQSNHSTESYLPKKKFELLCLGPYDSMKHLQKGTPSWSSNIFKNPPLDTMEIGHFLNAKNWTKRGRFGLRGIENSFHWVTREAKGKEWQRSASSKHQQRYEMSLSVIYIYISSFKSDLFDAGPLLIFLDRVPWPSVSPLVVSPRRRWWSCWLCGRGTGLTTASFVLFWVGDVCSGGFHRVARSWENMRKYQIYKYHDIALRHIILYIDHIYISDYKPSTRLLNLCWDETWIWKWDWEVASLSWIMQVSMMKSINTKPLNCKASIPHPVTSMTIVSLFSNWNISQRHLGDTAGWSLHQASLIHHPISRRLCQTLLKMEQSCKIHHL